MSIHVSNEFIATLKTRAAEAGLDFSAFVASLVKADKRPIQLAAEEQASVLDSIKLNHGKAVGERFYVPIEVDAEIEREIYARAIADHLGTEEYLRQRLEART